MACDGSDKPGRDNDVFCGGISRYQSLVCEFNCRGFFQVCRTKFRNDEVNDPCSRGPFGCVMFENGCGNFLENGTGFSPVIQCFVQRVREQSFPDFDVLPGKCPWLISGPIVQGC